jgi:flagellar export protein FliJ
MVAHEALPLKKFAFKLEVLLKLRKNQRDECQRLLADVLRHDDELAAERRQTEADRLLQIDELRSLGDGGKGIDVDASSARRFYAAQLSGDLGEIEVRRAEVARQIDACRQSLVRADQAVRSLEKLAEKQQSEFVFNQERVELQRLEETWQAIKAGERERC